MGNSVSAGAGALAPVPVSAQKRAPVHTFYSSSAWVECTAVQQLADVASLPGVTAVAAMPDIHPGKYGPAGCAILSDRVHPALVGSDIGCGMGLFKLDVAQRKLRLDKVSDALRDLDGVWDGDVASLREAAGVAATDFDTSLGTIGGGNHFCEVQAIDEIVDGDVAASASLDRDAAFVLVHSGSRGLGYAVLEQLLAGGLVDFDPTSEMGRTYMAAHDAATRWARLNRQIIARRAAEALKAEATPIADLAHNMAEITPAGVLHRKGAAPSDRGLVPIPGSRGTLSYLVKPVAGAPATALATLAHGAGRKYDRTSMIGRAGRTRSEREALARNPYGGFVVCEDRGLLIEEAPQAYKAIGDVIDDLVRFGLVTVVATFKPLVTFKKAATAVHDHRDRARERDKSRRERRRKEDRR
jgi:release factor H-coupled RctB family protein